MTDVFGDFRAAIQAVLGHAPEVIEPGRFYRFATSDRRADDAGWCKLFDDMRGGIFGCYRQGISETWSVVACMTMTRERRAEFARRVIAVTEEREARQRQQWTANAQRIARIWAECKPLVRGDPCALYLARRGFGDLWPLPEALRFHHGLPYWHHGETLGIFPVMVAPIIAPGGRAVSLHRTYLAADGHKAEVPSPKKLTGAAGPLTGACIPLHKPAHGVLGVAEGIETALAASLAAGVPTIATYCAGAMARFLWPSGVRRLAVFADNDKAGREAAGTLRARALARHVRCEVLTPTADGADWCDVWANRDSKEATA